MLERIIITLIAMSGLALMWVGWLYCKTKITRSLPSTEKPSGKPTLLYFTGDYCAVCKFQQSPIIDRVSAKLGSSIAVDTLDVSAYPDAANRYKVLTLPTTVVLNEQGQVTHVNYGLAAQAKLEAQLSTAA